MNHLVKKLTSSSILTALCLSHWVSAGTFTDNQGRKIEASVIEVLDTSVKLKLDKNGRVHTVPFSKLSKEDVERLQTQKKEKSAATAKGSPADVTKRKKKSPARGSAQLKELYGLEDNYDASWPGLVSVDVKTSAEAVSEDTENQRFIYHSPNYEFISDARLSQNVVNKFSVMFEATREYVRQLPISSMKAHVPGAQHRNKILLFENFSSYVKNGAPAGSAGVYMSGKDVIMVPFQSLGLKKVGSGYMYDYDKSNRTLTHEIVHQLTDHEYYYPGAMGWFSEGLAEYCSNTPYRSGKFMVKTNAKAIEAFATGFGKDNRGRNIGSEFNAPDLESYMTMSYSDFAGGKNGNFNYAFGMLVTYYFFHMEDDRSNITAFLKALKEGKKGQDAIDVLLNGRTYAELQEQVSKKWKSKGVKINFRSSD